jgi:hypothetical protein
MRTSKYTGMLGPAHVGDNHRVNTCLDDLLGDGVDSTLFP